MRSPHAPPSAQRGLPSTLRGLRLYTARIMAPVQDACQTPCSSTEYVPKHEVIAAGLQQGHHAPLLRGRWSRLDSRVTYAGRA